MGAMSKVLQIDVTATTKGRPPGWVPKWARGWFTWNTSKRIREAIPVPAPNMPDIEWRVLGGVVVISVVEWCLQGHIEYAGLESPMIGFCVPNGDIAVNASVAGFSVKGHVALVDAA